MTSIRLDTERFSSSARAASFCFVSSRNVMFSFGLVSITQAVSPAPDGDYPGGNTAEGYNALFSLSPADGGFNTAIGWASLFANATGSFNTALGAGALALNTSHNNTATGAAAL